MLENILMAFSVGKRVVSTLGALKNDVESFRAGNVLAHAHLAQLTALDKRTADLELLAKEQDNRVQKLEKSLTDTLTATEALARRTGMIFWMALAGCLVGVSALFVAVLALVLRR